MKPRQTGPMTWGAVVLLPATAAIALFLLGWLRRTLSENDVSRVDPLHLGASSCVAFGLAIWLGLIWFHPQTRIREALRLSPVPGFWVVLGGIAGAALQIPLAELSNGLAELSPMFQRAVDAQLEHKALAEPESFAAGMASVVAVVAVAPWAEELLFRGLLLPGLAERYGETPATWMTTFAFGCIHPTPASIASAWVAGWILARVALRTRSVVPCVALHAGFNGVPLLLSERVVSISGFNRVSRDVLHVPWSWIVVTAACAFAALAALDRSTLKMRP